MRAEREETRMAWEKRDRARRAMPNPVPSLETDTTEGDCLGEKDEVCFAFVLSILRGNRKPVAHAGRAREREKALKRQ